MKQEINVWDYAPQILQEVGKGVLLTTQADGEVNSMTIGWGTFGVEWGKPLFVAFVRPCRYTHEMIEATGEFTVNIPMGDAGKILGFCGTKSGRDVDKITEMGLTLVESGNVSVPGIKELPLTLECKKLYKLKQDTAGIPQDIQARYYPADGQGNQDFHFAYYGEIVGAYMITE